MKQQLVALALLTAFLSGCASYSEKFRDKRVANISYFAESTITLMGNLDLTVTREDTLLIRRFIDPASPEVQEVTQWNENLRRDLADMVAYSIELVNVAEEQISEAERVKRYADYIAKYRARIKTTERMDVDVFDRTIHKVRQQDTLIAAVRAAQPIFNAASLDAAIKIEYLTAAIDRLAKKLDAMVDADYAGYIESRNALAEEKTDILAALETIHAAYRLDAPDLSELVKSGVVWDPELIPDGPLTREDLGKIREHLQWRLDLLHEIQQQVEPDWEDYIATHKELDFFASDAVHRAHQARITLLIWGRAHQKMASGVVEAADWFDVSDLALELIKNSPKALL